MIKNSSFTVNPLLDQIQIYTMIKDNKVKYLLHYVLTKVSQNSH